MSKKTILDLNKTYISMETPGHCNCCGRKGDLRFGHCFDCAEAQSIIVEGKDMFDRGDAKTALDKIKMMIEKGWKPPEVTRFNVDAKVN